MNSQGSFAIITDRCVTLRPGLRSRASLPVDHIIRKCSNRILSIGKLRHWDLRSHGIDPASNWRPGLHIQGNHHRQVRSSQSCLVMPPASTHDKSQSSFAQLCGPSSAHASWDWTTGPSSAIWQDRPGLKRSRSTSHRVIKTKSPLLPGN